uniref:Tegument protein UL7 n=1 Tax=Wood mouse herpesvirus TaxID=432370 RepID=D0PPD0_9GAMA|nr:tegument protein UL7 [Wood mouse herpesvirus]
MISTNIREARTVILPRLMLEITSNGTLTVASHTPIFQKSSLLDLPSLTTHLKTKLTGKMFKGFLFATLCETEDHVTTLDMHPHVFEKRLVLYNPRNTCNKELCALISMVENLMDCDPKFPLSIYMRGKRLFQKNPGKDSCFLFKGLSTLISTHFAVYHPNFTVNDELLLPPLLTYKMHSTIEGIDTVSKGLLKAIYLDSYRMDNNIDDFPNPAGAFTLLCLPTIFTKHLTVPNVLILVKRAGLMYEAIDNICL